MYDVNTKRIEEVLTHLARMLDLMDELSSRQDGEFLQDQVAVAAMERALHLSIEAIVDVGNALIDGFIMRDPGSYTDIVEILRDERVITGEQAAHLTEVVEFRKHLVNEYTRIPVEQMVPLVRRTMKHLREFAPAVRDYLKKELF